MKKEKGKKGKREISILRFDEECQNVGLGVPCETLGPMRHLYIRPGIMRPE